MLLTIEVRGPNFPHAGDVTSWRTLRNNINIIILHKIFFLTQIQTTECVLVLPQFKLLCNARNAHNYL